jgi:mRNA interferase HicA
LSDTDNPLRGNEFIRRVEGLAKQRRIDCYVNAERGKGSHVTLYYGERFTVVRNPKDDLKKGTYFAMLKQLGLKDRDLY